MGSGIHRQAYLGTGSYLSPRLLRLVGLDLRQLVGDAAIGFERGAGILGRKK
jgi:hypothetical protein